MSKSEDRFGDDYTDEWYCGVCMVFIPTEQLFPKHSLHLCIPTLKRIPKPTPTAKGTSQERQTA